MIWSSASFFQQRGYSCSLGIWGYELDTKRSILHKHYGLIKESVFILRKINLIPHPQKFIDGLLHIFHKIAYVINVH